MANGKSLPQEMIELWPEIFEDVELNVVPLNYVHTIEIIFKNQKIWEIDFKKTQKNQSWASLEEEIKSIIKEYENDIRTVNFNLDSNRIKKDISLSTKKFLKSKKLK